MDPLRPFTGLIRTLWKSSAPSTSTDLGTSGPTVAGRTSDSSADPIAEQSLRASVRLRLSKIGIADPKRARTTFIESVLAAEFGDQVSQDPAFGELVSRVAEQLAADPRLGGRLQALLEAVVTEAPPG